MRPGVLSTIGVLVAVLPCVGSAGPPPKRFGRFGFTNQPVVPRFELTESSVRAAFEGAATIQFGSPGKPWRPALVNEWSATFWRDSQPASAAKVRTSLLAPGIELYFPNGFSLRVGAPACPYLSWSAGSVGPNVAIAPSRWALVSFRESQPPVLLSFLDGDCSVAASGKPGDWAIKTVSPYSGWVRVGLPYGLKAVETTGAASLGRQVATVKRHERFWTDQAPNVVSFDAERTVGGVVGTWRFDRSGAVVPPVISRSKERGYAIEAKSRVAQTGVVDREGRIDYCLERSLSVTFPMAGVPLGRALTWGDQPIRLGTPVSPFEPSSVAEVAFANLLAARDEPCYQLGDGALADFLVGAPQRVEPTTKIAVPFAGEATSLELASAQALLMQSLQNAAGDRSPNALADSIGAAIDSWTWRIDWRPTGRSSVADALCALAAWLHPSAEAKVLGGMLQAGIIAEQGSGSLLDDVRASAFSSKPTNPLVVALLSPVRVASSQCVVAQPSSLGWTLTWPPQSGSSNEIVLAGAQIAGATPLSGLSRIIAKNTPDGARLAYRTSGSGSYRAIVAPQPRHLRLPPTPVLPTIRLDRP